MTLKIKQELVKRSPLRVLERSLAGGLGKGRLAVLASRKGVGKTACLVHMAADKLIQGKPVLHVSYSSRVDYIIKWYEDIFKEMAKKRGMKGALAIYDEIVRNRVIMNFKQDGARTEQVLRSLEAMIVHGNFPAETLIVDGLDFAQAGPEDLERFKEFAARLGLEVWFSASLKGDEPLFDENGVPLLLEGLMGAIDVLITLRHRGEQVQFNLVKGPGKRVPKALGLRLDPTTLLIARTPAARRTR
jgi:hypothetical protein